MCTNKITSTHFYSFSRQYYSQSTRKHPGGSLRSFLNTLSEIWNFGTPKGTVWTQTHWEETNVSLLSFFNTFHLPQQGKRTITGRKSWSLSAAVNLAQACGIALKLNGMTYNRDLCVWELCVWSLWMCMITIRVIFPVFGLAGALSVSILLSVELVLSQVLLCRSCKTGDTTIG